MSHLNEFLMIYFFKRNFYVFLWKSNGRKCMKIYWINFENWDEKIFEIFWETSYDFSLEGCWSLNYVWHLKKVFRTRMSHYILTSELVGQANPLQRYFHGKNLNALTKLHSTTKHSPFSFPYNFKICCCIDISFFIQNS